MFSSSPYCFTVGTAPELIEKLKDVTVAAPAEGTMACKINLGEPSADVTWYKNGRDIRPSEKFITSCEKESLSLTIKSSEAGDSGNYMCSASNKLGRVDTEATFTVNG